MAKTASIYIELINSNTSSPKASIFAKILGLSCIILYQTVGQELLKAHQNRHKLDLQVEEKGIDGPVTRVDRYLEQLTIDTLRKSYKNHSFLG